MTDLISRADAIALYEQGGINVWAEWDTFKSFTDAIRALPAVEVGVKPLEWFEVEKYRYGGKYTSEGYTIRYVEGFFILDFAGYGKAAWRFPTIEAAKAAAQSDYDARIRSALTTTPAIEPAKVQALVEQSKCLLNAYDAWARCVSGTSEDQIAGATLFSRTIHLRAALAAMKEGE